MRDAAAQNTGNSVGARFLDRCESAGLAEAFRTPASDGGWNSVTWSELARESTELAAGLLALGVTSEQRVAIASSTRLEWVVADLAIMLAGAATTTIYPSTKADDVAYILEDCNAVAVFVEDGDQVAKLRNHDGRVGTVRHVITFDPDATDDMVLSLEDLAERGRAYLQERPGAVRDAVAETGPDQLATIIYTSGTTGRPKGVELTHGNWLYLGAVVASEGLMRAESVQLLWLPLSHVFGKMLLTGQYEVGCITAIDGRVDRIIDNLATVRPNLLAAAPRIFEKIYSRVVSAVQAEGGEQAEKFSWAFRVGIDAVHRRAAGKELPPGRAIELAAADRMVFAKIRQQLGGRLEVLISGSAALSPQIATWFAAAGLPVLEGYGLTETTGAAFCNRLGKVRIGTVGHALPGTEVSIAADGEILLRSPGVMRGYHRLPAQTAAVLDDDGWFATGDIGELDADGYLRITDRKKDLVKTSGGKYIAPTAIESAIKAACPLVSTAIVVAEGRNFASALLTLDPDAVVGLTEEAVQASVERAIAAVNGGLNQWETIKQFRILPHELSVEAGELTPSLKIKRAIVAKNYADVIAGIYGGAGA
jgi:long-chain acyl-CoA synthetase